MKKYIALASLLIIVYTDLKAQETYAEKLGYPKGSRVIILHVDDVGMSWDSNQGAIQAIEKGVATSLSIMMPCPWVPGFVHYMKDHPNVDAGLHLTLTSEWKDYRWSPLTGKPASPGLVDSEGAFWATVPEVVQHAKADEVEAEIRAQIERARSMGFEPTHLDSHMGTLFAHPEFTKRYIQVGVENKIPVMFPGGHNALIGLQFPVGVMEQFRQTGQMIWTAGLPVLDDLHNLSYEWKYPAGELSDAALQKFATGKYIETLRQVKPGLTMVIMHCTSPTQVFGFISDSGKTRKGDMLAMMDPELKKFLEKEGFILTTWREVKQRREKIK
ncbi:MAG TPA: polysaccharide deacetylase family protein [Ohtaekwangia sp.]